LKQIVVVGGDPGGAAALAPVLQVLQKRATERLRVLGYRQAVDIWARGGIAVEPLPDTEQVDPAAWVGSTGVDLLVTSTSVNGVDHERSFRRWAAAASVPSVAVLDFWTNYAARFRRSREDRLLVPSVVAVMDEYARREMTAAGFPPDQLVVTGQPAFDAIGLFRDGWDAPRRCQMREQLAADPDCRIVLFLSQPLATEMAGLDCSDGVAMDEREILRSVASALDTIASAEDVEILLAVRPHPRERLRPEDLPALGRVRTVLAPGGDAWSMALAADLVVGIKTALLVEACLLGCVVVSVQPAAEGRDPLPTNRSGRSLAVYDLATLPRILRSGLLDEELRGRLREASVGAAAGGATGRVLELIDRTMALGGGRT
jgi:hypothetical protein